MVGVIGGYGNIGRKIIKLLIQRGHTQIRIGSRKQADLSKEPIFKDIEWQTLDINDEKNLHQFMAQHTVVLNVAGPSSHLSLKVAKCAREIGCHLIDCGYNHQMSKLTLKTPDQSILYNMGAVPGLSELLPLALANEFQSLEDFYHCYSITGTFTKIAATDFIEGLLNNRENKLPLLSEDKLNLNDAIHFFTEGRRLVRYENQETNLVNQKLKCNSGQWYNVICGSNTETFFKETIGKFYSEKEKLITELCLASEMDSQFIEAQIAFYLKMSGQNRSGDSIQKHYYLKAPSQQMASASFCVATYESLLEGNIESGIGSIEKIKNPTSVLEKVIDHAFVDFSSLDSGEIPEEDCGEL